ncbi:tetratricopeptide repeat protein, partial [Echinicola sediminis]
ESLDIDKFNFGVLFEKYLISNEQFDKDYLKELIRDNAHTYLEYALDYAQAGMYSEAKALLKVHAEGKQSVYPMVYYALGYFNAQMGDREQALYYYKLGAQMPTDYCFPNRLEEVIILQGAIDGNQQDDRALYYLGNFWLAKRHYEDARTCWEKSLQLNSESPLVLRNLSLIYYNKFDKKAQAQELLERAFALDKSPRLLMELDQLYKKINMAPTARKTFLGRHMELVNYRDDVYLEYVTLLNMLGEHEQALDMLMSRQFHPWEGGEGKVPGQYILSNVELAKIAIEQKEYRVAIKYLEAAQEYPHNLGEGKLFGAQENDVFYWLGCAYEGLEEQDKAKQAWRKASEGLSDPSPAMYYNDQQPDKIFYQGLALLKLGDRPAAMKRFNKLVDYGETHIFDDIKIDYFAVSLPDLLIWDEDLNIRNQIHCNYLIGLGKLGSGEVKRAGEALLKAAEMDNYHVGVHIHKNLLETTEKISINETVK